MTKFHHFTIGLVFGLVSAVSASGPVAAQELPTGAARVVERVQTRIFISKASLLTRVGQIQANVDEQFGER